MTALVAGDPRGLDHTYRTYADRLYTYCRGVLRDPDAAADAVHDTLVLASQRAVRLRHPDRLRSWLYAIARNECLRVLRGRARLAPLAEAGLVSTQELDPATGLPAAEIQELVWSAAESLSPGDREVFELAVRHALPAQEVSELLGVSVAQAHTRLSRARSQLERALGALLVARTGADDCPRLAKLLDGWDGRLTALIRKRLLRHIDDCDICTEQQSRQLHPAALFSGYAALPFLAPPELLWPRLELTCFDPGLELERAAIRRREGRFDRGTGFPRPLDQQHRRRVLVAGVAAVAVAALLAGAGGALIPTSEPSPTGAAPPAPVPDRSTRVSPTASPTASPTPSPTASPTPSASPESPTPSPEPPPPPPPPPPETSGPPPLRVEADGQSFDCGLLGSYQLRFTASASVPIDRAQVTYRVGSGDPVTERMDVDGRAAEYESGPRAGRSEVEWSVSVLAENGQRAETNLARLDPCD